MATDASGSTLIVNSRYFHVLLQNAQLSVISIKNEFVPKCAWWLVREYGLKREKSSSFRSLMMDDDGMSLVCDPCNVSTLKYLIRPEEFTISPMLWRALIINVTGTAFDLPGAVYFLANTLSQEGLSIFHISTFESEVFLIQDADVEKATAVLKEMESKHSIADMLDPYKEEDGENLSQRVEASQTPAPADDAEADDELNLDMSWMTPNIKQSDQSSSQSTHAHPKDGFHLSVLPNHVILAKLKPEADINESSDMLMRMLLHDPRFSPLERYLLSKHDIDAVVDLKTPLPQSEEEQYSSVSIEETDDGVKMADCKSFMWGLWSYDDEVTILMEEADINNFSPNALLTSPQRWRIIKLCGRPIAFDETGIASSMSKIETNIPSLNISTALTNCTLVPEELLDSTLLSLSEVLKCTFGGS